MVRAVPPQTITITDLNDPRVDPYRNVRDADLRGRDKLFMAESELVIRRLLRTPQRLHSLLLSPNKYDRLRDAIDQADLSQVPIYLAPVELISEIAGFLIHRGALAAGHRPLPKQLTLDVALGEVLSRESYTLLVAEGITNVDNMGGLFRNAAAFGIDGIVLDSTCCDPLYRKAIRVSAGHALSIAYAISTQWVDDLARLKQRWGVTLLCAEACDGALPLWKLPCQLRTAVLFGSEAHGVRSSTVSICDGVYEVPMTQDVPSLNVATASAVFLYELMRSRQSASSKSQ